jgi:hypothetical protein
VLACLSDLLPEVAEYHLARQVASRKRKTEASLAKRQAKTKASQHLQKTLPPSTRSKKRARDDDDPSDSKRTKFMHDSKPQETAGEDLPPTSWKKTSAGNNTTEKSSRSSQGVEKSLSQDAETSQTTFEHQPVVESISQISSAQPTIPIPSLLEHCTFGINEVTKRLEALANPATTNEARSTTGPRLRVVLVCRADVDPPLLIAHFPILVATCNSSLPVDSSHDKFVKLVTLPMGAEHSLAEITGLRRVAVMALDVSFILIHFKIKP